MLTPVRMFALLPRPTDAEEVEAAGDLQVRRLSARRHDRTGRGGADRGQGRALSAHKTSQAYAGYAKRTERRMLAATRKRHAHRLANETATSVQNEQVKSVQNEGVEQSAIAKWIVLPGGDSSFRRHGLHNWAFCRRAKCPGRSVTLWMSGSNSSPDCWTGRRWRGCALDGDDLRSLPAGRGARIDIRSTFGH